VLRLGVSQSLKLRIDPFLFYGTDTYLYLDIMVSDTSGCLYLRSRSNIVHPSSFLDLRP
jgi:hypothetical protein